jgi:hypothetical protein
MTQDNNAVSEWMAEAERLMGAISENSYSAGIEFVASGSPDEEIAEQDKLRAAFTAHLRTHPSSPGAAQPAMAAQASAVELPDERAKIDAVIEAWNGISKPLRNSTELRPMWAAIGNLRDAAVMTNYTFQRVSAGSGLDTQGEAGG